MQIIFTKFSTRELDVDHMMGLMNKLNEYFRPLKIELLGRLSSL